MNNTFYNFNNGILEEDATKNTHTSPFIFYGNIVYSCGNGIINAQGTNSGTLTLYSFDNAFGAITSNAVSNLSCNVNSKTLTASPFIDTTDFKINTTSGGGALLKGLLKAFQMKRIKPQLPEWISLLMVVSLQIQM